VLWLEEVEVKKMLSEIDLAKASDRVNEAFNTDKVFKMDSAALSELLRDISIIKHHSEPNMSRNAIRAQTIQHLLLSCQMKTMDRSATRIAMIALCVALVALVFSALQTLMGIGIIKPLLPQ
jgi:hypothetical protein